MKHLTSLTIQEYLDNMIPNERRPELEDHVSKCDRCKQMIKSYRALDSALKKMQPERLDSNFTMSVMKHLGVKDSPTLLWSIFKNLAPILGLIIIISSIYLGLRLSGNLEGSGVGETITATQTIFSTTSSKISSGTSIFTAWMKNIIPFQFTKTSYGLIAFVLILFLIIGILDKLVFMPFLRRKM